MKYFIPVLGHGATCLFLTAERRDLLMLNYQIEPEPKRCASRNGAGFLRRKALRSVSFRFRRDQSAFLCAPGCAWRTPPRRRVHRGNRAAAGDCENGPLVLRRELRE